MKAPSEDFMRQFRWITPLLVFLLNLIVGMAVFMAKDLTADVRSMKGDITELKCQVAMINGRLLNDRK